MNTLATIAPYLVAEVGSALTAAGREALVSQLKSVVIQRCTYSESDAAGYIYFVRPTPSPHFAKFAAPVAETIPFLSAGFNVDVDHDGHIFGIEFLDRADFVSALKAANAL